MMEMATTAISKNHSFRTKFIIKENKRFIALKNNFLPYAKYQALLRYPLNINPLARFGLDDNADLRIKIESISHFWKLIICRPQN